MTTTPRTSVPTTVSAAFWILLLGMILDIVGAILLLGAGLALVSLGDSDGMASTISGPVVITAAVIALLFVAVELVVVFKMRAGKNWARVVITILEVLAIGSIFTSPSIWSWGGLVLSLIAVVLMWLPSSNPHFRRG
ncbi:hypothetical protein HF576_08730 [Microbacterium sp. CFH 90308]|uniref:Integral membrane protein n=1 Tax=Microbacterium salsuginis TaxID=2722803 RepID=A0ABX1KEW9_9MICO|nr:hypothetical protein [Microbacterium sp. CFH 90308]NLP83931.1 hypothetical protein [Microbacterium sp. CFH 90308]